MFGINSRNLAYFFFLMLICLKAGELENTRSPQLVSTLEYLAQKNIYSHAAGSRFAKGRLNQSQKASTVGQHIDEM